MEKAIVGYHYTNTRAYESIKNPGRRGFIVSGFDRFTGLIPLKRFVSLGDGKDLPQEAHKGVIEGLLEPEPESWLTNPQFPHLWRYLMHDICREKEIMLLRFELRPGDGAYVVDRTHVERMLYTPRERWTEEGINEAFRKYWKSRIPVFEYQGGYDIPQLAIWSGISFERLNVEWVKSHDEVWKKVLDRGQ